MKKASQAKPKRPPRKDPLVVTLRHLHILLDARLCPPKQRPEQAPSRLQMLAEALLVLWSAPFWVFHKGHKHLYGKSFEALHDRFQNLFASVKEAASLPTPDQVLQEAARLLVCSRCSSCIRVRWLTFCG